MRVVVSALRAGFTVDVIMMRVILMIVVMVMGVSMTVIMRVPGDMG